MLHCQSQLKRHRRYFCQLYRSPLKKKEKKNTKMLYIFHITCCKVLICEALIKTLLNDLWIAISHSAFLLFYTFLWVTIAAINFVCILLTNQLLLKTVYRINAYWYGVLEKLFSAHNRRSNLMFEFFAGPWSWIQRHSITNMIVAIILYEVLYISLCLCSKLNYQSQIFIWRNRFISKVLSAIISMRYFFASPC